jgi:hypothetical protein
MPKHDARLLHRGDGLLLFTMGPVVVHAWATEVTATLLRKHLAADQGAVAAQFPDGIAGIMVVRHKRLRPPDAAARAVLAEMDHKLGPRTRAVAVVVEGSGLASSIVRAVMSGVQLAARTMYPSEVFATIDDAAAFVAARVKDGPTAAEIVAAFAELDR